MSCTIDNRPHSRSRGGSVLMEFVIVLPIYILLWGMVFLIGDMGLKSVALAVGDRVAAFDADDRTDLSFVPFKSKQLAEIGLETPVCKTYRSQENFKGSWSWQGAGLVQFAYRLQTWGGGLLVYPFLRYVGEGKDESMLRKLVDNGAVSIRSKDYSNVRAYNYYTLKRTELARGSNAYRNWSPDRLVKAAEGLLQHWFVNVYEEAFADSNPMALDQSQVQDKDELPELPEGRREYRRSFLFMMWSQ